MAASCVAEAPPRRRMVRPLRQHVNLQLIRVDDAGFSELEPMSYGRTGRAANVGTRPGRLLNVRV